MWQLLVSFTHFAQDSFLATKDSLTHDPNARQNSKFLVRMVELARIDGARFVVEQENGACQMAKFVLGF